MLLFGALLADRRQLDLSFEATKLTSQVSRERDEQRIMHAWSLMMSLVLRTYIRYKIYENRFEVNDTRTSARKNQVEACLEGLARQPTGIIN